MGYSGVMWNCVLERFNLIPMPPQEAVTLAMRRPFGHPVPVAAA